jgi:hypothetical protein
MQINFRKIDCEKISVDRDDVLNDYDTQGFDIHVGPVTLHFEDENDAEELARLILGRLGVNVEL